MLVEHGQAPDVNTEKNKSLFVGSSLAVGYDSVMYLEDLLDSTPKCIGVLLILGLPAPTSGVVARQSSSAICDLCSTIFSVRAGSRASI